MNKKILYKLLLIFVLLACTLLISNTKSFAVTGTNVNGETLEIPDFSHLLADNAPYYFVYMHSSTGVLRLVMSWEKSATLGPTDIYVPYARYLYEYNDEWILVNTYSSAKPFAGVTSSTVGNIYYSNFDIVDNSGNVVFQAPPLEEETPVEEKQATTLAPIVEGVEAKKTLAEVVGILPVVLVVILGLLAMRKAIRFLMRILKQG